LTLASTVLMLGASAGVAFIAGGIHANLAVAVALALALVLDTADGHLARIQGTASEFGRWLDATLDEWSEMVLHAAIAWSAFARDGHPVWLLLGMLYGMGKYLFFLTTTAADESLEVKTIGSGAIPAPNVAVPAPLRPSVLTSAVRLAGHADIRWHLWIVLAAVGRLDVALAAYAAYFPVRAVAAAVRKGLRHA
jgi:phosphatidylglycerophosphate synthase